ncbi:MAG: CDP-diacylglycerol--glycerol-3-phosphate 3-phosphatidyltransferase [Clostridiales bacterium]|nr:CDP-diacylglycerol--glycerol-3-phosphate 3-phosphatidyltransferase [Clostridiales bacterium]
MTTANMITLARIALIPVFMFFLYSDFSYANIIALVLFSIASLTDGVDGYIARKYNQVTNFGKFIDPLADKLLVTAAILIFVEQGRMPAIMAIIILSREFVVTSLRVVAISQGKVIAAARSGKIKTVTQIICILIMLSPFSSFVLFHLTLNTLAVWTMTLVTLYSGYDYLKNSAHLITGEAMK